MDPRERDHKTLADDKRIEFRKDVQVRCSGESERQVDDDRNDFDGDGKSEITERRRAKCSASFPLVQTERKSRSERLLICR